MPVATTQALTNLGSGFLVERIRLRTLLALALALQALALWLAPHLGPGWFALFYGLNLGAVFGLQRTVSSVAWAKYFGRRYLGSIRGVTMFGAIGGTALGAYPLGLSFDHFGSYSPALNSLLLVAGTIAVLAFFVKRPQKLDLI